MFSIFLPTTSNLQPTTGVAGCELSVLLFYDERHKRHGASFLDGIGQGSLVFGASPMPLRRIDLALGVHESFDQIDIFEIYLVHLEVAEMADFLFGLGRLVVVIVSHLVMGHKSYGSNSFF